MNIMETKLTSVKILKEVYSKFKKVSFESNMTLQKIVNRSLDKYINEEEYRESMNSYVELQASGSQY
jgi:hypothetical protein